jgi:hypothetical protein
MPSVRLNGRIVPESAFKAWLPLGPLDLHNPISRARTVVYMERFASRSKRDGWLIQPLHPTANGVVENEDPLFAQIARTHTALRSLSNGDYRLTWYVYRGNEAH